MDEATKAALRAGGRLMHTADQHEVICFRPEALAAFVAAERERLSLVAYTAATDAMERVGCDDVVDKVVVGEAVAYCVRRGTASIEDGTAP